MERSAIRDRSSPLHYPIPSGSPLRPVIPVKVESNSGSARTRSMKKDRSLQQMLQSTSDSMFPAEMGERVVTLDSRDSAGDTPLHLMIWPDDRLAVRGLLEAGAQIDAIGDMSQTPLHVAVMRGNEFLAELLLAAGADPDIRSEFGDTPKELAQTRGDGMKRIFKLPRSARTAG